MSYRWIQHASRWRCCGLFCKRSSSSWCIANKTHGENKWWLGICSYHFTTYFGYIYFMIKWLCKNFSCVCLVKTMGDIMSATSGPKFERQDGCHNCHIFVISYTLQRDSKEMMTIPLVHVSPKHSKYIVFFCNYFIFILRNYFILSTLSNHIKALYKRNVIIIRRIFYYNKWM